MRNIFPQGRPAPRRFVSVFFVLLLLPLVSCASRINGVLRTGGEAELQISAALEPRMAALIRGLAAVSGSAPGEPALNGPAIAKSMSSAPGIDSVSFQNTAPAAIEGQARISQISDFLAGGAGRDGFVSFTRSGSGGRCLARLNRETGPLLLSLISPQFSAYLEALMAPLATGETLSKAEYLALVGAVYGKAIADEISQSSIRVSLEFPGPIQSAGGGTFSGRRADFTIPLPDILVLETPLRYEVTWQ